MASIYWRNGRAWGRTRYKGQEIRQPLGTTSKREAQKLLQTWIADLKGKRLTDGSTTTYEDAVDAFLEHHIPTLKESSQKRYMLSLLTINPFFKGKKLCDITRGVMAQFVTWRRNLKPRKGRKAGVTAGTIRRDLACLSSVFTIADDHELCDENPVTSFMRKQKKRGLNEAPSRTRYLAEPEEERVIGEFRRRYHAYLSKGCLKRAHTQLMITAAVILAIDTGLRHEELLGLRRTEIDWDNNEIIVLASTAKNGRERRVPILERSRSILEKLPESKHTDIVLWHRGGVRFYDLNQTLQKAAAAVGVHGIRWHDLRRTCGCRLLQVHGFRLKYVSEWLGHASVKQTEKAYAFLNVKHLHAELRQSRTIPGTRRLEAIEEQRENA